MNTINDLSASLFDVISRLKDPQKDNPLDAKTAQAICLAARRLIETAHVELEFRSQLGRELDSSDFMGLADKRQRRLKSV